MTKWVKNKEVVFTCQRDIFEYLLDCNNAVKNVYHGKIASFDKGYCGEYYFNQPKSWIPMKRAEWYEDIPENGVLCWLDDINNNKISGIVVKFDGKYFKTLSGSHWKCAKPLTKEEVLQYILHE